MTKLNLSQPCGPLPVLIIGTGCTGLALAQGLKKAQIPCKVFEQKASLIDGERDWNMGIHWGIPALQSLAPPNFDNILQALQVDPNVPTKEQDFLQFLNGETGDTLAQLPANKFYRLLRSRLRGYLHDGVEVAFNKRLEAIEYSSSKSDELIVTASFQDGTRYSGCLIVGADGPKSTVRRLMLPPDQASLQHLPYAATFVHGRYSPEQARYLRKFHPLYIGSVHPRGRFAFFGTHNAQDDSDPGSWIFFMYISWPCSLDEQDRVRDWSSGQHLGRLKMEADNFTDPWRSAVDWLPSDAPAWHMSMKVWDPSDSNHVWDNQQGRVTLAGDAAHPMTFQRGQGLNHSITDAQQLRDQIAKAINSQTSESDRLDLATAISNYEHEMKSRGGQEVRLSVENTELLHDWNLVSASPLFRAGLAHKSD